MDAPDTVCGVSLLASRFRRYSAALVVLNGLGGTLGIVSGDYASALTLRMATQHMCR